MSIGEVICEGLHQGCVQCLVQLVVNLFVRKLHVNLLSLQPAVASAVVSAKPELQRSWDKLEMRCDVMSDE